MYMQFNGAYLHITRGEEDITNQVLTESFAEQSNNSLQFPNDIGFFVGERYSTVFNTVVNWFAAKTPEQIIEEQYDVFIQHAGHTNGQKAFLSIIEELPFLTFEKLRDIQLPLGRSAYSKKMSDASLISKTFASETVNFLMENGTDKEIQYSRKSLWRGYVLYLGGETSDFKELLNYYTKQRAIEDKSTSSDDGSRLVLHLPFPWTPATLSEGADCW